jgi:hypothetical protein
MLRSARPPQRPMARINIIGRAQFGQSDGMEMSPLVREGATFLASDRSNAIADTFNKNSTDRFNKRCTARFKSVCAAAAQCTYSSVPMSALGSGTAVPRCPPQVRSYPISRHSPARLPRAKRTRKILTRGGSLRRRASEFTLVVNVYSV